MEIGAQQDVEPLYACGEVCCRQWIRRPVQARFFLNAVARWTRIIALSLVVQAVAWWL